MRTAIETRHTTWLTPFDEIRHALLDDEVWGSILGAPGSETPDCGVHLAVVVEPYLTYFLDGTKTVESRFSSKRCVPFGCVKSGDAVLLKRAGGPVVGIALVQAVWSYRLDEESWKQIRQRFSSPLRARDDEFWNRRRAASFATLMAVQHVSALEPVEWDKRDRRGWVVLQRALEANLFGGVNGL